MPKKKTKKEEEPEINVVDRRSSMLEVEEAEQQSSEEDRLPSYVERLKKEAEEKDLKLKQVPFLLPFYIPIQFKNY